MRTFSLPTLIILLGLLVVPAHLIADDANDVDQRDLIEAVGDSLVIVEWTLKFDQGDPPLVAFTHGFHSGEQFVRQERPLEQPGFLLDDDVVVTTDPMIHARFIDAVHVRFGDQRIKATAGAMPLDRDALLLELDGAFDAAKPLSFEADADEPFFAVNYEEANGLWTASVTPVSSDVMIDERGREYESGARFAVVVNEAGEAVGVMADERRPADRPWKASPMDWPKIPANRLDQVTRRVAAAAGEQVVRVQLGFRSPRQNESIQARFSQWSGDDQSQTERHVAGVVLDNKRLLVLAQLEPKLTARLERITVHHGEGESTTASFEHSLRDLGAFTATLDRAVGDPATFSKEDVLDLEDRLMILQTVNIQGQQVERHELRYRPINYERGWRGVVFPRIRVQDEGMPFTFDLSSQLVTLPIARRLGVSLDDNWREEELLSMPVAEIREVLENLPDTADPNNVPLSEEEESRLAWLGVELQPLGRELAREHGVAHLTRDGELGGLVVHVYPDSPAAEAGIEPGVIMLRVEAEGEPKPIDVQVQETQWSSQPFPWAQYDQIPEQYYEQLSMAQPWPQAETPLTRKLTDLGFGRDVTLVMVEDGEVMRETIEVEQSPAHYGQASKYESEAMGVTVRDLTYEVRMYFQRKPGDPGVIVSRVEPGSKGSVAGIKPHEIITHVNDQPVMNVDDFERLVTTGGELKLTVVRMTRSRVVKVELPADAPAEGENDEGATEPTE